MKGDLKFEVVYPYTLDQVWRALTDASALGEWLMPNDFEPRLGHKFQFHTKAVAGFEGTVGCEILEFTPPKRLVYSWRGANIDTVVSFTLEPVAQGTRLVLEHTGFAGTGSMSSLMSSGWEKKLHTALPGVLARLVHPAAPAPIDSVSHNVHELLARYERGTAALEEALQRVPASDFDRQPAPGQWSARQVTLHIVDAEIVGAARLRMLAAQPGALLKSYKGDIWAEKLDYKRQPLEPALALFRSLRQCTREMLRTLPQEAWSNQGIHEESGEVTLESLLESHSRHAEDHIEEINALSEVLAASQTQS
jgi:uncharacterized protein YndB with AHSA1/START domain